MPMTKLEEFLNLNGVPHQVIPHPLAFTATSVAGAAHLLSPPQRASKRLRQATDSYHADLAQEWEFVRDFPGCEPGAMPPFGNLFGLPVYVEPHLAADAEIAFNAGTHTEVVRMAYKDFERLVRPTVVEM